ncbi:MAG: tryptophan synthase subunit alpha [Candidatus Nezhaarchaeota archaeon]|nr:tryptophan synthase subunit alpha [Candidatus Nezhaarchaeota archaeon]MCX8142145.1 tryptophan synthase subunit alpha [Candidatus Nezhaarchaeota archaeon]MDW8050074.1 BtpA/SgcQ family protein [Nitrososphaerota archaeon]
MPLKQIIGVIHLPRLPSVSVKPEAPLEQIVEQATKEAEMLERLNYSGVLIENYGDAPYRKRVRDPLTLTSMSVIVREVVKSTRLKVGINLLRNSGREAYSMAAATGAKFVRINTLIETIVSDSGVIEPEAPRLKALRINYPGIEIYADILVKHALSLTASLGTIETMSSLLSRSISKTPVEDYLRALITDYIERGGANVLIVTGLRTGELPPLELVKLMKKYSTVPVLVGSGITPKNIREVLKWCDGVIVGSYIKKEGKAGNPLDPLRAEILIKRIEEHQVE